MWLSYLILSVSKSIIISIKSIKSIKNTPKVLDVEGKITHVRDFAKILESRPCVILWSTLKTF